jgi:acetyl-CoA carboxylase carboxyl transferase subunit alpha
MPKPEGYRKALRVMRIAEKFSCPIFTFIDTPGAFPGIDAEERGQAEAIARNLLEIAKIHVPIIVTILGEGGSGGALAIAIGDKVLMLENSIYSVISPEGCAAILWKDASQAPKAAHSLKLTANDLLELNIIDEIIGEPLGGVNNSMEEFYKGLYDTLRKNLESVMKENSCELIKKRYAKFRNLAYWGNIIK